MPKSSSRPLAASVDRHRLRVVGRHADVEALGDPEVARFVQQLGIPPLPAAAITSLVTRPALYLLMRWASCLRRGADGCADSLPRGSWRELGGCGRAAEGARASTAAYREDRRGRPPVVGFSFPSTFATTWFSVWLLSRFTRGVPGSAPPAWRCPSPPGWRCSLRLGAHPHGRALAERHPHDFGLVGDVLAYRHDCRGGWKTDRPDAWTSPRVRPSANAAMLRCRMPNTATGLVGPCRHSLVQPKATLLRRVGVDKRGSSVARP